MSLPVLIYGVSYKVAGSYAFKGTLVLTEGVIYYVPLKHLRKTKPPDIEGMGANIMLSEVGFSGAAKSLDDSIRLFSRPTLDLKNVWSLKPSDEELKGILDAYIDELKKHSSYSSDDLPAPSRYSPAMVTNLMLSTMGRLKFDTEYEDHIFKIGVIRKNKLRAALTESGFMS
jgi:hypothetical protein